VGSFARWLSGALVLALLTAGCSNHTTRPASPRAAATPAHVAAARSTTELRAHLGDGVPAEWKPVDEGNARVWVPDDWQLERRGGCVGSAAGVVGLGPLDQTECGARAYPSEPRVAVAPWSSTHQGTPLFTVHGYAVYKAIDPYRPDAGWAVYDVPELAVQVALRGTLARRVLDTLGPSALEVALDAAHGSPARGWRSVHADGITLSIPPTWASLTPALWSCEGWAAAEPAFFVVKPDADATCSDGLPPVQEFADGAVVYVTPTNRYAPSASGRVLATLHHGSTTIEVRADGSYADALDLFVRRAGSSVTHVLTLGLGPDGRVAAGVLASIRA
jgi:hypothetical protein